MQKANFLILLVFASSFASAQEDSLTKTRIVIGLAAPELIHLGFATDLGQRNQVGFSAGLAPSWGSVWPSLNVEHRFYFGGNSAATLKKKFFLKQGFTFFTADQDQKALTFTLGADLKSKARHRGWTIDLGAFLLLQNDMDRQNKLYPAIRFQYYAYTRKNKGA